MVKAHAREHSSRRGALFSRVDRGCLRAQGSAVCLICGLCGCQRAGDSTVRWRCGRCAPGCSNCGVREQVQVMEAPLIALCLTPPPSICLVRPRSVRCRAGWVHTRHGEQERTEVRAGGDTNGRFAVPTSGGGIADGRLYRMDAQAKTKHPCRCAPSVHPTATRPRRTSHGAHGGLGPV